MSRTKTIRIRGRFAWTYDNSLDIVLAHVVEVAVQGERPGWLAEHLDEWRVSASVADYGLAVPDGWSGDRYAFVARLVDAAEARVRAHGDVQPHDLRGWSVFDETEVSGGFLRTDRLGVPALLDVVDGVRGMLCGDFPADPPGGAWFLGSPAGRRVIPMSRRAT
jgi:hypothetical protein